MGIIERKINKLLKATIADRSNRIPKIEIFIKSVQVMVLKTE